MIPFLRSPDSHTALGDTRGDDVDSAVDLLSNRRRRAVLLSLDSTGGSATISELAAEIAAQEFSSDPNVISDHRQVSTQNRRAVQITLHHTHVPKLASEGAVEYDTATKTVLLTDRGRTLLSRHDAVSGSPQRD
ncbi:DUF7344 domain-containing protein [Natrinema gelatinilyticum]|uniref:DUF7344 domain-containing protein n=1 Tax=Natrinema gelatinilyticum TaxID=2961571 RepID=UPI0020C4FB4A|nr:hypothetical protein [Natrinema gelatinilyticum]